MVSDKPPRRSKSDKSPVTIDLPAEDVTAIATPVRSDDSDIASGAGTQDADIVGATEAKPPETKSAAWVSETEKTDAAAQATAAPSQPAESKPEQKSAATATSPAIKTDAGKPADASKASSYTSSPFASAAAAAGASTDSTSSASTKAEPHAKPSETRATATPEASKEHPRSSPAVPALVAAGIFGGIVALLLAGSMQYAGYLPGATASNGATTSETASLQQQIDTLSEKLASSTAELPRRVDALEKMTADGGTGGAALTERLAVLEAQLADTRSSAAASGELSQRLQTLETKVEQPGKEQAVATALAASALKTAIDRGGPFTGELQTFAGIAKDDPAAQNLQKFAETGVPSASELIQKFPLAADAILNAAHGTDAQAGVGSRLLSSALQMVKVRPVGNVQGDTPEAIVARMEDRLRKGDLKAAAEQWNALPQEAKDASIAYKQSLDARIEVDGLVDNTLNRAIAGAGNAG